LKYTRLSKSWKDFFKEEIHQIDMLPAYNISCYNEKSCETTRYGKSPHKITVRS